MRKPKQKIKIDKKYVKKKAKEAYNIAHNQEEYVYGLNNLIAQIVSDIEDKHWCAEQYYLDTIKELKKDLDEIGHNK